MKATSKLIVWMTLLSGAFAGDCRGKAPAMESWSLDQSAVSTQLKHFVAEKESQSEQFSRATGQPIAPEFKALFAAAAKGDCQTVTNFFDTMLKHGPQYDGDGRDENMRGPIWETVKETTATFQLFVNGGDKYMAAFGRDVIQCVPPGSIYFGSSDPGRFLVTALSTSQPDGQPFFTLTQNALADRSYLDYLRLTYRGKIYTPTHEDHEQRIQDYEEDAWQRLQRHELKPGEMVFTNADKSMEFSGQVAVMEMNARLVKTIFDHNPGRQFYIEENYPLDWLYPYLEPHGLILKINRTPLSSLPDEVVAGDQNYWGKYLAPMIGDGPGPAGSVAETVAFAEKVYLRHDLNDFKGDPEYTQNMLAQKTFSDLRCDIGGVYEWRALHAAGPDEKTRMSAAADFAFRQAWALCPYSPMATVRYVNFLLSENRIKDALLLAETAAKFPPTQWSDPASFQAIASQLKHYQIEFQRGKQLPG